LEHSFLLQEAQGLILHKVKLEVEVVTPVAPEGLVDKQADITG